MPVENRRELLGQNLGPEDLPRDGGIDGVAREEFFFLLKGLLDAHVVLDVLLRPQLDADVAELERHVLALKHPERIRSPVHYIDFG